MSKTVLLTGATDGIGFETAKLLVAHGHKLLLHGRNEAKAQEVKRHLLSTHPQAQIDICIADFSSLTQVKTMAQDIMNKNIVLDVIINNAGVFMVEQGLSVYGLDIRFIVNTMAPYLLTRLLVRALAPQARIINLSSRAQMPLTWESWIHGGELDAQSAYAQSKLGIAIWSMALAKELKDKAVVTAINPKSFLGSKMVKEAYGQQGYDVSIGANLLYHAAFSEEFSKANGMYYDNDVESFASPHPQALDDKSQDALLSILDTFLQKQGLL